MRSTQWTRNDESTVWLDYTQDALNRQYDQASLVPEIGSYMARWAKASERFRRAHPPVTLRYGDDASAQVDVYPGRPDAPVHLHIHGGAWRAMHRRDCGFVARGLSAKGATIVVAGFPLVPHVRLPALVDHIRQACLFTLNHVAGAHPLYVSGHSSGAHLASCLMDPDWQTDIDLDTERFGGFVLASGPYDLEPVRLSARNEYLDLSQDEADRLSPVRRLNATGPRVDVIWGDGELAEFKRQSRAFADKVAGRGSAHEVAGRNHFDIYSDFEDPTSAVITAALAQMH
ncbi:alpha/beta hydrolase [Aestuariivita sp.]|uniref:alpha/beta hydrolase n=1 Tax=Aestuariivita sp. TaxID=1872407 RepID=UPI0021717296|nr:alpha/beta hydrolase [Aestuariivita sp.]MCE8005623.1 alpha/beta hydrolase [Aestuariivita sp.]